MSEVNGNSVLDGIYAIAKAPAYIKNKAKEYLLNIIGPIQSTGTSGVEEAPIDTKQYGRQDGAWTEVVASSFSGDMDDIPDGTTYVKTENNYTDAEVSKLSGIATGAEVNVQSDWNETNSSSDAYILNKPTIPTGDPWTHLFKTSTQQIKNNNTLFDDADLQVALTGTGTYIVHGYLMGSAYADPDVKIKANFTGTYSYWSQKTAYQAGTGSETTELYSVPTVTAIYMPAGRWTYEFYIVFDATSAGTFSIQWAQNTSHSDWTWMWAGSSFKIRKIV